MNFEITQSLQRKLERRIERLKNVEGRLFPSAIRQLLTFLENEPIMSAIFQEFINKYDKKDFPSLQDESELFRDAHSEEELYSIIWWKIKELKDTKNIIPIFHRLFQTLYDDSFLSQREVRESLFNLLIQPFCDYFIEQLDNQQMILSFIQRYKQRSEWFRQAELMSIHNEEMKRIATGEKKHAFVEDRLASDLYSYLFDEGINFHISPLSKTGRVDVIEERRLLEAQASSTHRLLADAKVFDGKSRNASYIGKGFGQILSYCKNYNEPFGYLIIFNISKKDLEFELENTLNGNPIYKHFDKTIVFIVIDIYKPKSDSTKGKASFYKVTKANLSENIKEES